jgi:hypothetical protein
MNKLWDRFESKLGNAASLTEALDLRCRRYTVHVQDRRVDMEANFCDSDLFRLIIRALDRVHPSEHYLTMSGLNPYWKFAASANGVLMLSEVFVDELDSVPALVASLGQMLDTIGKPASGSITEGESRHGADELWLRRLCLGLATNMNVSAQAQNGFVRLELRHSSLKTVAVLTGRPLAELPLMELNAQISPHRAVTAAAHNFLLRCNSELLGCRATLDNDGLPRVVSFVSYSVIESGAMERRYRMLVSAFNRVLDFEVLNDRKVSSLYQQIIMKGENNGRNPVPFDQGAIV